MKRLTIDGHAICWAILSAALLALNGCTQRVESAPTTGSDEVSKPSAAAPSNVAAPSKAVPGSAASNTAPATETKDPPHSEIQLFNGWPKPKAALFVTGDQHGYIEPCGCSGLSNQKGGLTRRHSAVQSLLRQGWTVVPIDVGNQVRRFGRQSEIKFQITIEGLKKIGYKAIGFGPEDLRLSALELVAIAAPAEKQSTPFVSANVTLLDPALLPPYQIIDAGGVKICVTSVLGNDSREGITASEIQIRSPEEALRDLVPKLEAQRCDVYVLLSHASIGESRKLAQQFPLFQLVVTAGCMGDPTYEPEPIPDSKTMFIQVGIKGMFAGVVGVFDDPKSPLRYQRVPLDSRFEDSREMLELLGSYQQQLQAVGLEGLGIQPIPYPTGRKFIGSEACKECHGYEDEVWAKSKHSHALDSLVNPGERSEVPRHFDPECLSCHVVGWNAQQHFPYVSGYLSLDGSPKLHHVGCESCHGPAAEHVAAEHGNVKLDAARVDALRAAVRLTLDDAEKKCMECHDLDNSPEFHKDGAFKKFWTEVEHSKKKP